MFPIVKMATIFFPDLGGDSPPPEPPGDSPLDLAFNGEPFAYLSSEDSLGLDLAFNGTPFVASNL